MVARRAAARPGPGTLVPGTLVPDTTVPGTAAPDTTVPGTAAPGTAALDGDGQDYVPGERPDVLVRLAEALGGGAALEGGPSYVFPNGSRPCGRPRCPSSCPTPRAARRPAASSGPATGRPASGTS
ncbi:hypothetical protein [Actinomadura sp. J1-007]|uniref:hypothetical protein n=1 Tax=Actinomadura sp. J1-007 TaxID=2661913 RepID=UPI00136ECA06|nr:hypothetical protein [Actinomadura sp. J1-007]